MNKLVVACILIILVIGIGVSFSINGDYDTMDNNPIIPNPSVSDVKDKVIRLSESVTMSGP